MAASAPIPGTRAGLLVYIPHLRIKWCSVLAGSSSEINPQVTVTSEVTVTSDTEKKKRTLTNLYNARPTWLDRAHKRLDEAVFAFYGWKSDLSDEEIGENLLALNLERSKGKASV